MTYAVSWHGGWVASLPATLDFGDCLPASVWSTGVVNFSFLQVGSSLQVVV
jgi:hypothetical protein